MLIGFSVGNYKSFKDTQSISFVASKIKRHRAHIIDIGNRKLLKSGLIFGANAGGKSNLIKAINLSRNIVLMGLDKVDLSKAHFRIEKEWYSKPGVFEYRIIANNEEYSYGFAIAYDTQEVVAEWLFKILPSGKEFCIFSREVNDSNVSFVATDIKFDSSQDSSRLRIYFEDFGESISENMRKKMMLADIATRSGGKKGTFEEIYSVYEWFNRLVIIFPDSKYSLLNELGSDVGHKHSFQKLMSYFDTGIESVANQCKSLDINKFLSDMPSDKATKLKVDLSNKKRAQLVALTIGKQLISLHRDGNGNLIYNKLLFDHGNPDDKFDYGDESDGTKRLFDLIPLLFDEGKSYVIIIDEIDRSLHTKLTRKFMELFFEKTVGERGQLIATTHDANLLDLDLMRQDEIWFVERSDDHSSRIFSLNKFKARFDKKIDKEYLLGRYGAVPIFDDEILEDDGDEE